MEDFDWRWLGLIIAGPFAWVQHRVNRLEDVVNKKADKDEVVAIRDDIQYIRKRVDELADRNRKAS